MNAFVIKFTRLVDGLDEPEPRLVPLVIYFRYAPDAHPLQTACQSR
jgi:hypothetical protein